MCKWQPTQSPASVPLQQLPPGAPAEASAQTTGQDGWWFLLPSNSPGSHNMQAANRKESGSVLYIILAVHSCSSFLPMLKLVVCSSLPCASKNTR